MSLHRGKVVDRGRECLVAVRVERGQYHAEVRCGKLRREYEGPTGGAGHKDISLSVVKNFVTRITRPSVSPTKARQILHDKKVRGRPLTDAQRKFMGAASRRAANAKKPNHWLVPLAVGVPAGYVAGAAAMHRSMSPKRANGPRLTDAEAYRLYTDALNSARNIDPEAGAGWRAMRNRLFATAKRYEKQASRHQDELHRQFMEGRKKPNGSARCLWCGRGGRGLKVLEGSVPGQERVAHEACRKAAVRSEFARPHPKASSGVRVNGPVRCNGCGYDVPRAGNGIARHKNPRTGRECASKRNPRMTPAEIKAWIHSHPDAHAHWIREGRDGIARGYGDGVRYLAARIQAAAEWSYLTNAQADDIAASILWPKGRKANPSKKDYVATAQILRGMSRDCAVPAARAFADRYGAESSTFDRARFLSAAGASNPRRNPRASQRRVVYSDDGSEQFIVDVSIDDRKQSLSGERWRYDVTVKAPDGHKSRFEVGSSAVERRTTAVDDPDLITRIARTAVVFYQDDQDQKYRRSRGRNPLTHAEASGLAADARRSATIAQRRWRDEPLEAAFFKGQAETEAQIAASFLPQGPFRDKVKRATTKIGRRLPMYRDLRVGPPAVQSKGGPGWHLERDRRFPNPGFNKGLEHIRFMSVKPTIESVRRVRLKGDYDARGRYWGQGAPLFEAEAIDGEVYYLRARDRADAIAQLKAHGCAFKRGNPLTAREGRQILHRAGADLETAGLLSREGRAYAAGKVEGRVDTLYQHGESDVQRADAIEMSQGVRGLLGRGNPDDCRRCKGAKQVKLGPRMVRCPLCCRKPKAVGAA